MAALAASGDYAIVMTVSYVKVKQKNSPRTRKWQIRGPPRLLDVS